MKYIKSFGYGLILSVFSFFLGLSPVSAAANIPNPTPRVVFTFDDGYASAVTKAAPILAKYGFVGVEYVTTDFIGQENYLAWDQVRSLQNDYGWEIGAHSLTHPLMTEISRSRIDREARDSKSILVAQGLNVSTFATPFGDYDNRVLASIAKYYVAHRPFHDQQNHNVWPNNDLLLYVRQVQAGISVEVVKSYVDQAKQSNALLILVFHDIKDSPSPDPEEFEYGTADLDAIANYVKNQGITVGTVVNSLVTGGPNLLPNSSFEAGLNGGWTTDSLTRIRVNSFNNGSYPSPKKSIEMLSSSVNTHLFSPLVDVGYDKTYIIKAFLNIARISSGEVGFLIDEYNSNGDYLSTQYKLGATEAFVEEIAFAYAPSNANVAKARLQVAVVGGGGIRAFLDNVQWFSTD